MTKTKIYFLAILLFASGILLGAVSHHAYWRYRISRGFGHSRGFRTEKIMSRLQEELDLSSDQSQKPLPIVEDFGRQFEALRAESRPRMLAIIDQAAKHAQPLLIPEQQQKLSQLQERVKARWERREQ